MSRNAAGQSAGDSSFCRAKLRQLMRVVSYPAGSDVTKRKIPRCVQVGPPGTGGWLNEQLARPSSTMLVELSAQLPSPPGLLLRRGRDVTYGAALRNTLGEKLLGWTRGMMSGQRH